MASERGSPAAGGTGGAAAEAEADRQIVATAVEAVFRWGLPHADDQDGDLEALAHNGVVELLRRLRDLRAAVRDPSPAEAEVRALRSEVERLTRERDGARADMGAGRILNQDLHRRAQKMEGKLRRSNRGFYLSLAAWERRRRFDAEADAAQMQAELVLLDEVCACYALDEARFLRDEGEPYGSVPIEAGMKARQAGRRFVEREDALLAERRVAAEAVIADPTATEDDRADARLEIEVIGYASERLAPLRLAAALADPAPTPAGSASQDSGVQSATPDREATDATG